MKDITTPVLYMHVFYMLGFLFRLFLFFLLLHMRTHTHTFSICAIQIEYIYILILHGKAARFDFVYWDYFNKFGFDFFLLSSFQLYISVLRLLDGIIGLLASIGWGNYSNRHSHAVDMLAGGRRNGTLAYGRIL